MGPLDYATLIRPRNEARMPVGYDDPNCEEGCVEAWTGVDQWVDYRFMLQRTLMPDHNMKMIDSPEYADQFAHKNLNGWWEQHKVTYDFPVTVEAGPYILRHFTLDEWQGWLTDDQLLGRMVPPGSYTMLGEKGKGRTGLADRETRGVVWMADTPAEVIGHLDFVTCAHGDVLINGLGMGLVVCELLRKPCVRKIHVVEREQDVIDLTWPFFEDDPRVSVFLDDAFTFTPPDKGHRYDAIYSDIWPTIGEDNLPEMHRLRRRYARHTPLHFCWEEDACKRQRKGYRG